MSEIKAILNAHKQFTKERNWDPFQTPKNLVMALSVEVGELLEVFMWLKETQAMALNEQQLQSAKEEIADVLIYLIRVADTLGIDLIEAAHEKMHKNQEKYSIQRGQELAALRQIDLT